jgi:hypothetical protein
MRELKRRGSKFVACYGSRRPPRYRRGWDWVRSAWAETEHVERPAFKVYRFRKGAWPEMILGAVMGAARHIDLGAAARAADDDLAHAPWSRSATNGRAGLPPLRVPAAYGGVEPEPFRVEAPDFGRYRPRHDSHTANGDGAAHAPDANGYDLDGGSDRGIHNGEARADPQTANGAEPQTGIEAERIADRFGRTRGDA